MILLFVVFTRGDLDQWAKMTNFEHATRIPLIIALPGSGDTHVRKDGMRGARSPALVHAQDIFPTLSEEALGVALPTCPRLSAASRDVSLCTEGRSLSPLLRQPDRPWATAAYSQFPRPEHPGSVESVGCRSQGINETSCPNKMGYSVRTDTYRYTAWVGFNRSSGTANWSDVHARELYNHSEAPVPVNYNMETVNLAERPESAGLVARLHAQVKAWVEAGVPSSP